MVASTTPKNNNPEFDEIEIIRDPDGVIAVITERKKDGRMSFAIYREFERNGTTQRSAFLSQRHIAGARRLLSDLDDQLGVLEDQARAKRRDH